MSEYVGIKAGALHEHTELSEYYCARCGCPVTDHDSYCRECGGAFQRSFATEPCDREALLALADELEEDACWEVQTPGDTSGAWRLKDACDRIREACGEAD